jgi:hypothetical protein
VALSTYGTPSYPSTLNYEPKYFLINGAPYSASSVPIPAGNAGTKTLLRFLNAGLKPRVPTLNGLNLSLIAEDGNKYLYAKEQYSMLLAAGKTMDALIMPASAGTYAVYDRRLGLTNNTASLGGMLVYLNVAQDTPVPIVPTGSVAINGGAATTKNRAVVLTLSAISTAGTVSNMRFSWDGVYFYAWEPYATTRNATIPAGADGIKTIYVQFRDAVGSVSLVYPDSIVLDTTAPTGSVTINGGAASTKNRAVALTLSATSTTGAVTNMRFSWDGVFFYGWETYATTRNATIPGTTAGTYTIRVRFRDAAGNVSEIHGDAINYAP